jgi:hypothetical protein
MSDANTPPQRLTRPGLSLLVEGHGSVAAVSARILQALASSGC